MMMWKSATPSDLELRYTSLVSSLIIVFFRYTCIMLFLLYIALFYYTLGNISPKHRAVLNAIQLVVVVKHSLVNDYGIDKIIDGIY